MNSIQAFDSTVMTENEFLLYKSTIFRRKTQ